MGTTPTMSSNRPYILRALHEWIVDNDCTPYMVANTALEGVEVPMQYAQNGQIVLNLSPRAVVALQISNEAVSFNARFGGVARDVYVPIAAVMGIYARENGQGIVFEPEAPTAAGKLPPAPEPREDDGDDTPDRDPPPGRPSLKIVK